MKKVTIKVHGEIGNIKNQELLDILNSDNIITYRNNVYIKTNSIRKRYVCSLNLSPLAKL